jgi:hypothetical protein
MEVEKKKTPRGGVEVDSFNTALAAKRDARQGWVARETYACTYLPIIIHTAIAIALGAQVWMDGYIQPMIEPQNSSLFPRLSVALPVAPGAIDT